MSVLDEVLEAVIDLAETSPSCFCDIVVGSLPPDEGISCTISAGSPAATDIQKADAFIGYAVLNGKSRDQAKVSGALGDIHELLTHTKDYPNQGKFQITNISTVAAPNLISREANSQWLYGSSLRIDFYYRINSIIPDNTEQEIE